MKHFFTLLLDNSSQSIEVWEIKMKIKGNAIKFENFKNKFNQARRDFGKIFESQKLANTTLTQSINDLCDKYGFKPESTVHYLFKNSKYTITTKLIDSETGFEIQTMNTTDIDIREASIQNLILLFDEKLPDYYVGVR